MRKLLVSVNCYWTSPAQSVLFSGPLGTHDHIFVLSKTFTCFEMGPPFSTRRGVWLLLVTPPLLGHSLTGALLHTHADWLLGQLIRRVNAMKHMKATCSQYHKRNCLVLIIMYILTHYMFRPCFWVIFRWYTLEHQSCELSRHTF
jgi:hypothetical protein